MNNIKKIISLGMFLLVIPIIHAPITTTIDDFYSIKTNSYKDYILKWSFSSVGLNSTFKGLKELDSKGFPEKVKPPLYPTLNPEQEISIIVEFEKEPLILYEKIADKESENSLLTKTLDIFINKEIAKNYVKNIKINSYIEEIKNIHQELIKEKEIITIKREWKDLMNGMAITIKRKDFDKIKNLPNVKNVWEDNKLTILLDDSVPLINADDVWKEGTAVTIYSECYQETANVSTDCGGLNTGNYSIDETNGDWGNLTNIFDGNWSTYGKSINGYFSLLYINYTKPNGALNSSLWQIKDNETFVNLTIPETCWNGYPDVLVFEIGSSDPPYLFFLCLNSTEGAAIELRSTSNTGNIYEEAMWWNISSSKNTNNITGSGIKVAILDSGIAYNHSAFEPSCDTPTFLAGGCAKVEYGYDFVNDDNDPYDDHGHGTHCAGIVASQNDTYKGVAPNATLIAYKVCGLNGSCLSSDIISAIENATLYGVDVISMSIGEGGYADNEFTTSIDNAVDSGIAVVIAAGNGGLVYNTIDSPGTTLSAITVGITDKSDKIVYYSGKGFSLYSNGSIAGIKPDVVAPGLSITSTVPTGSCNLCDSSGYKSVSGTSMSTPHVAGVVALLKQAHPDWTVAQLKSAISNPAVDIGKNSNIQGSGRVDAYNSYNISGIIIPNNLFFGTVNIGNINLSLTENKTKSLNITNTQNFEITYNLSINFSELGMTISLSNSSINLQSNKSALFDITMIINNSLIAYGTYYGKIVVFNESLNDILNIPFAIYIESSIPDNYKYTGFNFSTASEDYTLDITWNGSSFFTIGYFNKRVYEYNKSGNYTGFNFDVSSQESDPTGIIWNENTSSFFVTGFGTDKVYEYNKSGVYTGFNFSVHNPAGSPQGITWNGSSFFIVDGGFIVGEQILRIYEFNSSGNYTGFNFSVYQGEVGPNGIVWKENNFFVIGDITDKVYKYTSSGVFTGYNFDVSEEDSQTEGITWNGSSFFVAGANTLKIFEYAPYTEPDIIAPIVTLINPPNGNISNNQTQSFVFQSSESSNCTLWHNLSGTFSKNQTWGNISANTNTVMYINMNTGNVYQNIIWNVNCSDASRNDAFALNNFTYYYQGFCYQETANVSTSCGGGSNGNYQCVGDWNSPCKNVFDGDWSTYSNSWQNSGYNTAYLYINYSKPTNAYVFEGSMWEVKDYNSTKKIIIDSNCFNQTPLQFQVVVPSWDDNQVWISWSCWNGTIWKSLKNDTNWLWPAFFGYVYEEGIYWNLSLDMTPPYFERFERNMTTAYNMQRNLNVSVNVFDNFNVSFAWFGTNNTGSWVNNTAYYIGGGVSKKLNFTYTLTASVPTYQIGYCVYANDTLGNTNKTCSYINLSIGSPIFTSVNLNSTNPLTNDTNTNITSHILNATTGIQGGNISYLYRWFNSTSIIAQSPALFYPESLVLYMPFDNDARDYALGNDGTVSGATLNKTDFKVGSGAYSFNGVSSTIPTSLTDNSVFNGTNGFTLSAWIRPDGVGEGSVPVIVAKESSSSGSSGFLFNMGSINNKVSFVISGGAGITSATNSVMVGSYIWYFVTVSVNSSAYVWVYVNEKLSGKGYTGALVNINTSHALIIGNYGTVRTFDGLIDDVAIWNRSFSSDDIWKMYIANLGKHGTELLSNFTKKGDPIILEMTPLDYLYWGSAVNSTNLTVGNIVPSLKTPLTNFTLNEDFGIAQGDNLNNTFDDYDVNESVDNLYYSVLSENTSQVDVSIGYENTTGLVLSIDADNGTIKDNSPVGNNLTNYGATIVNGYVGKGMGFDGVNSFVNLGHSNFFDNISSVISIETWFYQTDTVGALEGLVTKWGGTTTTNQYMIRTGNGAPQMYVNQENTSSYGGAFGGAVSANVWHHFVGIANGTHLIGYVDNVLSTTTYRYDGTIKQTIQSVYIGRDRTGYMNGSIDGSRIRNYSMSPSEINQSYNAKRFYFNSVPNQYGNFSYVIGASDGDSWGNTTGWVDVRNVIDTFSTLYSPPDLTLFNSIYNSSTEVYNPNYINFICLINDTNSITNVTLFLNNVIYNYNDSGLNNHNYTFTENITNNGDYNWNCKAEGTETVFAPNDFMFTVSLPLFNFDVYKYTTNNIILNWSVINITALGGYTCAS